MAPATTTVGGNPIGSHPDVRHSASIDSVGRRHSAAEGMRFPALMHQKRALGDPVAAARRESFNDQHREAGWIESWWNNMVRGGGRGSWGGWGSSNVAQIKGGSTANSVRKEEWDGYKGQTRE